MIPYSAAMAMDYMGYHHAHQQHHHRHLTGASPTNPMMAPGAGGSGSPFAHSWLVPSQDLYSAVTYNQFSSNQPVTHKPEPILDPRHVEFTDFFWFFYLDKHLFCDWEVRKEFHSTTLGLFVLKTTLKLILIFDFTPRCFNGINRGLPQVFCVLHTKFWITTMTQPKKECFLQWNSNLIRYLTWNRARV